VQTVLSSISPATVGRYFRGDRRLSKRQDASPSDPQVDSMRRLIGAILVIRWCTGFQLTFGGSRRRESTAQPGEAVSAAFPELPLSPPVAVSGRRPRNVNPAGYLM
jgi:hypothetical protein